MNRFVRILLVCVALVGIVALPVLAQQAATQTATAAGVTPEAAKTFFDANALLIIFVWGLICKFAKPLAKVPNTIIPWVGAAGYILTRLALPGLAPDAHAALSAGNAQAVTNFASIAVGAFVQPVWARQLWEGFGRSLFEGLLRWKKPVLT